MSFHRALLLVVGPIGLATACVPVVNPALEDDTGESTGVMSSTNSATTDDPETSEEDTGECTPGYPGCPCMDGLCLGGYTCVEGTCEEEMLGTETGAETETETEGLECIPGQEMCPCDQSACDENLVCGPEDTCIPTLAELETLQQSANETITAAITTAQALSWPTGPAVDGLRLPFDNPLHLGVSATTGCGAHQGALSNGVDFSLYGNLESYYNVRAVAAAAGTVIDVVSDAQNGDPSYGNYVLLHHADETYTLYAHLGTVDVAVDDVVCAGEVLGTIGMTGDVSGELLHFEHRDASGELIEPVFEEIASLPDSCDYYCGTADPTVGCLASVNAELCTFDVIEDADDLELWLSASDPSDVWVVKPGLHVLTEHVILGGGTYFGQPGTTIDLDGFTFWLRDGDTARFENMEIIDGGAFWDDDGGTFLVTTGAQLDLYKIQIRNSFAGDDGGAILIEDGASVTGEQIVIADCVATTGAAILLHGSTLTLTGAVLDNNDAVTTAGGIYAPSSSPESTVDLTNVIIANGNAGYEAGGFVNGVLSMDHCTVANNVATSWTGGFRTYIGDTLNIQNSIFYNNVAPDVGGNLYCPGTCNIDHSLITTNAPTNIEQGYTDLGGNLIGTQPQFVQFPTDLHLAQGSPASGAASEGHDMGAYGGPNANLVPDY